MIYCIVPVNFSSSVKKKINHLSLIFQFAERKDAKLQKSNKSLSEKIDYYNKNKFRIS